MPEVGANLVATMLYKGQGYKCIMVPEGAKWSQPRTSPDIRFNFMMKLLKSSPASNQTLYLGESNTYSITLSIIKKKKGSVKREAVYYWNVYIYRPKKNCLQN